MQKWAEKHTNRKYFKIKGFVPKCVVFCERFPVMNRCFSIEKTKKKPFSFSFHSALLPLHFLLCHKTNDRQNQCE